MELKVDWFSKATLFNLAFNANIAQSVPRNAVAPYVNCYPQGVPLEPGMLVNVSNKTFMNSDAMFQRDILWVDDIWFGHVPEERFVLAAFRTGIPTFPHSRISTFSFNRMRQCLLWLHSFH